MDADDLEASLWYAKKALLEVLTALELAHEEGTPAFKIAQTACAKLAAIRMGAPDPLVHHAEGLPTEEYKKARAEVLKSLKEFMVNAAV